MLTAVRPLGSIFEDEVDGSIASGTKGPAQLRRLMTSRIPVSLDAQALTVETGNGFLCLGYCGSMRRRRTRIPHDSAVREIWERNGRPAYRSDEERDRRPPAGPNSP
jgi:hypothetical protein